MDFDVRWSVTGSQFESFVQQHSQRLAMVHFWAEWNPLDPAMFEVFDEVHQAVGEGVALGRVQVGPMENAELCQWLGIVQVPTVIYVFRNQIIDVKVGYSKNRLVGHVQRLLQACQVANDEAFAQGAPMPRPYETTAAGYFGPSSFPPGAGPNGPVPVGVGGAPNSDPGQAWLPSAGFGAPVGGPGGWGGGVDPNAYSQVPMTRFGLVVGQPIAPLATEGQKKSWLSRWLGME
jgi:thiol-disulfide isomerase/thioredoxin